MTGERVDIKCGKSFPVEGTACAEVMEEEGNAVRKPGLWDGDKQTCVLEKDGGAWQSGADIEGLQKRECGT